MNYTMAAVVYDEVAEVYEAKPSFQQPDLCAFRKFLCSAAEQVVILAAVDLGLGLEARVALAAAVRVTY